MSSAAGRKTAARPRAAVPAEKGAAFAGLLKRRAAREPLAHLTGHVGFWTLDLAVSGATLVPRPDSEAIVESALAAFPDRGRIRRVLDLGTGTGALLLAVLAECPEAWGWGGPRAGGCGAGGAQCRGERLGGRACFVAADWDAPLAGRFDLVLSNPPYIESAAIPG